MIIRHSSFISNPVVACGIIVYNQRDYISDCIEGMLRQECDVPFNMVIADDCSTDCTQDVLRKYQEQHPDKIKLVLNEQNKGIAGNWVSCCQAMEGGRFVTFCDGDDYWSNPNKIQMQVDFLLAHPDCVAVSTDFDMLNMDRETLINNFRRGNPPITGMVQKDLWSTGKAQNAWCTFMFIKDVFDAKIPFPAFIDNHFPFQDWPALVIMSAYGEFEYIPVSTCVVRQEKGSDSNTIDLDKIAIRQAKGKEMCKYLANLFPDLYQNSDEELDRYFASTMISACILNNKYRQAKMFARKSKHKNIRYWCCQTWVTFSLYRILKILREKH